MIRRTVLIKWNKPSAARLRTAVLAALFLLGVISGIAAAQCTSQSTSQELFYYFAGYYELTQMERSSELLLSSIFAYFRYPVLAVLFGFSSLGVIAIPFISAIFGFFMAFSVSCLTIAFGDKGPLLAVGIFGPRSVATIFCFFLLAVPALDTAISLASLSFGTRRRVAQVSYGKEWLLRVIFCIILLTVVLCIDFCLTPKILEQLLAHIL